MFCIVHYAGGINDGEVFTVDKSSLKPAAKHEITSQLRLESEDRRHIEAFSFSRTDLSMTVGDKHTSIWVEAFYGPKAKWELQFTGEGNARAAAAYFADLVGSFDK